PFTLRYTTDGTVPTEESAEYEGPLTVTKSETVSFALVSAKGTVGDVTKVECVQAKPEKVDSLPSGLRVDVYEGDWQTVPDFTDLRPVKSAIATVVDVSPRTRDDYFALRYTGLFVAPVDGVYRFRLGSDDGSYLKIAGAKVIDNDGLHGYVQREGAVRLAAGAYPVEVGMFESGGAQQLTLEVLTPDGQWTSDTNGLFVRRE
ncbi:MAG TPA: PA14 domain-containing protein, partial [Fimbriimonadaceae bacterium]|nr:PA14 domain-containing protein [Fimbriimonadaceae bacterium]